MTQATDTDIREIRDLLLSMDKKIDAVDRKLDVFAAEVNGKFAVIDQLLTDLGKRMDNLEQRNIAQDVHFWGFLGVIVTALIGLLSKLAFFPGGAA
jgi:hypothetical protein